MLCCLLKAKFKKWRNLLCSSLTRSLTIRPHRRGLVQSCSKGITRDTAEGDINKGRGRKRKGTPTGHLLLSLGRQALITVICGAASLEIWFKPVLVRFGRWQQYCLKLLEWFQLTFLKNKQTKKNKQIKWGRTCNGEAFYKRCFKK